jgi:hypothetical protein
LKSIINQKKKAKKKRKKLFSTLNNSFESVNRSKCILFATLLYIMFNLNDFVNHHFNKDGKAIAASYSQPFEIKFVSNKSFILA